MIPRLFPAAGAPITCVAAGMVLSLEEGPHREEGEDEPALPHRRRSSLDSNETGDRGVRTRFEKEGRSEHRVGIVWDSYVVIDGCSRDLKKDHALVPKPVTDNGP